MKKTAPISGNSVSVRKVQLIALELIRLFISICEKEHLTYYMLCGTMLGAIRHKGFIPWDDDVDFGMPRLDYEKFLLVAPKYIPNDILMVCFGRPEWDLIDNKAYFTRMENLDIKVVYTRTKKRFNKGVWIDIFPLDGMPNGKIKRKCHQIEILTLLKLYTIARFDITVPLKKNGRAWYNRIATALCANFPIQRFFSIQKRWIALDKALKKYSYEAAEYIVNATGVHKFREMYRKDVFDNGSLYEFEGMKLRGPKNYHFYLSKLYGDYMVLPPEAERNWHGAKYFEEVKVR